jgi:hypothetical protein
MSRHQAAKGVMGNPLDELSKNHFRRLHPARITEPRSCRVHPLFVVPAFKTTTYKPSCSRRLDTTGLL